MSKTEIIMLLDIRQISDMWLVLSTERHALTPFSFKKSQWPKHFISQISVRHAINTIKAMEEINSSDLNQGQYCVCALILFSSMAPDGSDVVPLMIPWSIMVTINTQYSRWIMQCLGTVSLSHARQIWHESSDYGAKASQCEKSSVNRRHEKWKIQIKTHAV